MQSNAPPFSLTTLAYILWLVATVLTNAVTGFVTYLLSRRKQTAETSAIEAGRIKIEAETRQIDSAIVLKAYERLDQLEAIIHQMNLDKVHYAATIGQLEWKLGLAESREKVMNESIRLAHAELEMLRMPLPKP